MRRPAPPPTPPLATLEPESPRPAHSFPFEEDHGGPIQFTLRELLIGITLLAIVFALCSQLMIVGALLVFAFAVIGTITTLPLRRRTLVAARMLTWGVLMPLICLAYDPMFFVNQGLGNHLFDGRPRLHLQLRKYSLLQFVLFGMLLLQMAAITLWVFRARRGPRETAIMNGILGVGFVFAACTAAVVSLFAAVGAGLGYFLAILGFTPIFTAGVFWVASGQARAQAEATLTPARRWGWALLGMFLALALPLAAALAMYCVVHWRSGRFLFS